MAGRWYLDGLAVVSLYRQYWQWCVKLLYGMDFTNGLQTTFTSPNVLASLGHLKCRYIISSR